MPVIISYSKIVVGDIVGGRHGRKHFYQTQVTDKLY